MNNQRIFIANHSNDVKKKFENSFSMNVTPEKKLKFWHLSK